MRCLTILAVDPGARGTGIVVRRGDQHFAHALIERVGRDALPDAAYLRQVNEAIRRLHGYEPDLVAVEDLHEPNPHVRMTDVLGALGAAMVLGAILDRWPRAVRVPPGRHGSGPLLAYPVELRGLRERKGTGARRHLRSAWDVAGMAAIMVRVRQGRSA